MKSAETIGNDGMQLLIAIYEQETTPKWLRQIPAIEILRQVAVPQLHAFTHSRIQKKDN